MQVQSLGAGSKVSKIHQPKNALQAFRSVTLKLGPRGLLQGYWMTNCVWLPWNCIYIPAFERSKQEGRRYLHLSPSEPLPVAATSLAAFLSAAVAAVLTHPFDTVKTNVQVVHHVSCLVLGIGQRSVVALHLVFLYVKENVHAFTSEFDLSSLQEAVAGWPS